ncbi:MAG: hypothetical protein IPH48_04590 [bacterium]|nr:hypothetical protein [bacterium]
MSKVTVQGLYQELRETLLLEPLVALPERPVTVLAPDVHRPGMALMGFAENFLPSRIQVFGESETAYLATLDHAGQRVAVERVLSLDPPVIFIAMDQEVPAGVLSLAREREFPLLRSALPAVEFMTELAHHLERRFAPSTEVHGTLVDVYGVGLLFTGPQRHRQERVRAGPDRARPPARGRRHRRDPSHRRGCAHRPTPRGAPASPRDPRRRRHRRAGDFRCPLHSHAEARRAGSPAPGMGRRRGLRAHGVGEPHHRDPRRAHPAGGGTTVPGQEHHGDLGSDRPELHAQDLRLRRGPGAERAHPAVDALEHTVARLPRAGPRIARPAGKAAG